MPVIQGAATGAINLLKAIALALADQGFLFEAYTGPQPGVPDGSGWRCDLIYPGAGAGDEATVTFLASASQLRMTVYAPTATVKEPPRGATNLIQYASVNPSQAQSSRFWMFIGAQSVTVYLEPVAGTFTPMGWGYLRKAGHFTGGHYMHGTGHQCFVRADVGTFVNKWLGTLTNTGRTARISGQEPDVVNSFLQAPRTPLLGSMCFSLKGEQQLAPAIIYATNEAGNRVILGDIPDLFYNQTIVSGSLGVGEEFTIGDDTYTRFPLRAIKHDAAPAPYGSGVKEFGTVDRELFGRLVLSESSVDAGFVEARQDYAFSLWNTDWRSGRRIQGLQPEDSRGLVTTPAAGLSFTVGPGSAVPVGISILPQGLPAVNTSLRYVDAEGDGAQLRLSYYRALVFPYQPDWAAGVQETLNYPGTVTESRNGTEERFTLAERVRRTVSVVVRTMGSQEAADLDAFLYRRMLTSFAVPLWHQVIQLGAAAGPLATSVTLDTRWSGLTPGSFVALRSPGSGSYQLKVIESLTDTSIVFSEALGETYPVGTALYPVMFARMSAEVPRSGPSPSSLDYDFTFTEI